MPSFWDANPDIWQPPQQPQGRPGAEMGSAMPQQRQPFNFDAFQKRAQELSAGSSGTNAEFQQRIFPQLAQEFQGLERFGSKGDKIRLPSGQTIDAVISAGLGGKGYNWGIEGPAARKPMMPTLGSIGQAQPPMPGPMATFQPQMMSAAAPQMSAAAPPEMSAPSPPPPATFTPQTVQGPQAMRIPGFANGVRDFQGGPAIVGERGPELLNLPPGSDVLPMGGTRPTGGDGGTLGGLGRPLGGEVGASMPMGTRESTPLSGPLTSAPSGPMTLGGGGGMPALGGPLTLGGGGQTPAIGSPGGITLGGGGGMPAIGQPSGGSINFGNGGGMPPIGGQPGQQPGPQAQGGYQYNPMHAPQNYAPQNVAGPDRLTLGNIAQPGAVNAQQVGPGQQVQPGMVQTGDRVGFERVGASSVDMPGQVSAERVQGPAALTAQQLGAAPEQRNLSAAELQLDPSYQFRRDQTIGALENSATAKGMLFHPNTARGLQETAGQLASQEYAAANARNLGVQQQNFQNQATVAGANNAANAQAYGLTNQFQQQAALANQGAALEAGKFNIGTGLQAGQFNASQQQQAALANQSAGLQAGQFNSAQQQQANLANIGNQFAGQQFNSQQGQQAALANQSANLNAGQFNANQNFQTQQANLQNQLAAYQAYQPLAQQNSQFNAQQSAAANQNNFANQFSVNQANNAGSLGAFNANLGAEMGRGNLALGNRQADQSFQLGQGGLANQAGQLALGNRSADQSYDLGLRANALGNRTADQNYGINLGQLGISQGQLDLAGQGQQYNQDLSTFNTNYGVYQNNQNTAFNQGLALANIGQGAAGNYGNQAGNYYSGQGNANGAAGINQGNAWAGALGNIGNIAGQAGAYYGTQPQGYPQGYGPAGAPPSPYGYG